MKRYITIFLTAVLLAGCAKQNLETTYTTQEDRIDSFITSQLSAVEGSYVVHNNGSNRIVLTEGSGEELAADGSILFYYAGYVFSGSMPNVSAMFATNHEETGTAAGWSLTSASYEILTANIGDEAALLQGLRDGLVGVKGGEECYVVFSGKYGYGDKIVGTIPANSALLYHIWVDSVSNN